MPILFKDTRTLDYIASCRYSNHGNELTPEFRNFECSLNRAGLHINALY